MKFRNLYEIISNKSQLIKDKIMKTLIIKMLISFVLLAVVNTMSAQALITDDNTIKNRAYLKAGIDPATTLTVGYERKIGLPFLNQNMSAYAEWGVSLANIENSELKIGGILPLFTKGSFKIVNNLNLSAGTMASKNFNSNKFAIADELTFGLYKPKWFIGLTAEYEKIILTRLEHSDFYHETYYEGVTDGWYKGAGGMFQFGIEGGRTFYNKYDIHVEFKFPFTEKLNSYYGSPAHINLGVGYRF